MAGPASRLRIDRELARERIARDVETLSGPGFTSSDTAIRRYAYTPEFRRTVDWFRARWEELGYDVWEDPVGTLVAQNVPAGTPVYGIGSHCDSNRNGGRWDGTLGVVVALEVCRLAREHGLELPLRGVAFLEEEGSGFGQMLLGSRICAGRVQEGDLRERFRAVDDGRLFWAHATEAGHEPERWREASRVLEDLAGWVECHIEQGRVLQDHGERLGIVEAIAGYVHADISVTGRADHAGATPMDLRVDALLVAAEVALELERLATAAGHGTVGTVGEVEVDPGLINVVPGRARISLDIRGTEEAAFRGVAEEIAAFAARAAERRGAAASWRERQSVPATPMDARLVAALDGAAAASGEHYRRMFSGAAHDTMCVADRAPTAMVFVPCRDGISHAPEEEADPADAALACEVVINALLELGPGAEPDRARADGGS
jgi:hydantoinase/carbamoylase family amidase